MSSNNESFLHNLLKREVGLFSGRNQGLFYRYAEDKAAVFSTDNKPCDIGGQSRSTFLMSFSPDGTLMASNHGDHNVHVTDVRTGEIIHSLIGHPRTPWAVTFHPTSNEILASGCLSGEVRVWDLHGGSESWRNDTDVAIASLSFHPTDQVLAIASDNKIYLWNWNQPAPFTYVKTASTKEKVRLVRFDPLGHNILTGIANVVSSDNDNDDGGDGEGDDNDNTDDDVDDDNNNNDIDISLPRETTERDPSEFPNTHGDRRIVRRLRLQLTQQPDLVVDPRAVANAVFNDPTNLATPPNDPSNLATPPSDPSNLATPPSNPSNLATMPSDRTNLATTPSDQINLATTPSDPSNLATPPSDPSNLATTPSDRTNLAISNTLSTNLATSTTDLSNLATHSAASTTTNEISQESLSSNIQQINRPMINQDCALSGTTDTIGPSTVQSGSTESIGYDTVLDQPIRHEERTARNEISETEGNRTDTARVSTVSLHSAGRINQESSDRRTQQENTRHARLSTASSQSTESINQETSDRRTQRENTRHARLSTVTSHSTESINQETSDRRTQQDNTTHAGLSTVTSQSTESINQETSDRRTQQENRRHFIHIQSSTHTDAAQDNTENQIYESRGSENSSFTTSGFRRYQNSSQSNRSQRSFDPSRTESLSDSSHTQSSFQSNLTPNLSGSSRMYSFQSNRTQNLSGSSRTQNLSQSSPVQTSFQSNLTQNLSGSSHTQSSSESRHIHSFQSNRTQNLSESSRTQNSSDSSHIHSFQSNHTQNLFGSSRTQNASEVRHRQHSLFTSSDSSFDSGHASRLDSGHLSEDRTPSSLHSSRQSSSHPRVNISIVVSRNRSPRPPRVELSGASGGEGSSHFRSSETSSGARTFAVRTFRRAPLRATRLNHIQQRRSLSDDGNTSSPLGDLRRARLTRFGFQRGTERSRLQPFHHHHHHHLHHHHHNLHQHYSISIFDDTNRPSPALHSAINRAIAGAFAGSGETAVASNIDNTTYRLQWWDFTSCQLPNICDADSNVIVENCKIHNDASCDISQDGTMLAAFVPSHRGFPDDGIMAIYSLQAYNFGDCLYTKSFGPNAISVSISPANHYVMIGLASRRLHWHVTSKQMVAQIFRLKEAYAGEDSCQHVQNVMHPCDVERRTHVSVNSARWLPLPGEGVVYGTNRGDLHICRVRLPPIPEETSCHYENGGSNSRRQGHQSQDNMYTRRNIDTAGRVRDYQMLGVVGLGLTLPPETNTTATQTMAVTVQSTSTQTENSNAENDDDTMDSIEVDTHGDIQGDTDGDIQGDRSDDIQRDRSDGIVGGRTDGIQVDTEGDNQGDRSDDIQDDTHGDIESDRTGDIQVDTDDIQGDSGGDIQGDTQSNTDGDRT